MTKIYVIIGGVTVTLFALHIFINIVQRRMSPEDRAEMDEIGRW